jgi:nucleotide-binding universal stress UspA family protein
MAVKGGVQAQQWGHELIKTILVPSSGSDTDRSVFAAALAVGQPFAAHLHFFHVHLTPGAAAQQAHLEYCQGAAISSALQDLRQRANELSAAAARNFEAFCQAHQVPVRDVPAALERVTAHCSEERDEPLTRLLFHARYSDLVVVGRRRNRDYLPGNLIQALLVDSGRPILIAPDTPPRTVGSTIVVGWKETPEAARAVAAALPLLRRARRVLLLSVAEGGMPHAAAVEELARHLRWHGISAEVSLVDAEQPAALALARCASRCEADLLIAGGFGHAPLREWIFGGVTQALVEHAELPVLMVH